MDSLIIIKFYKSQSLNFIISFENYDLKLNSSSSVYFLEKEIP